MKVHWTEEMNPHRAFQVRGGRMTYEGGKDSTPPPAPDYTKAAQIQADSSQAMTTEQTYANRPDQITPWGTTEWSNQESIDPATGATVTKWTQNQSLTPELQQALDSQIDMTRGRSDLAASTMDRVAGDFADPISYDGMQDRKGQNMSLAGLDTGKIGPTTQTSNEASFSADRRRLEDAALERMRPEKQFQDQALSTQLSNQGLTPGSRAYDRAKQQLRDQHSRDDYNAIGAAGDEQARMEAMLLSRQGQAFGQEVTSQGTQNAATQNQNSQDITEANFANNLRQQQIAEEERKRTTSLNEMNAIASGQQVASPQMPGFVSASAAQPVQALTAAQATNQSQLDAYNASQANNQGAMSGLFGLGGTALGAIYGGPAGAAVGGQVGSSLGRSFG